MIAKGVSGGKEKVVLEVAERELSGHQVGRLRESGQVPGVISGAAGQAAMLIAASYAEMERAVRAAGYHSPLSLVVGGKPILAMVKHVAFDPVNRRIVNVEFHEISASDVVTAFAPIELIGAEGSDAAKAHLNVSRVLEEVEVKAKPADLPSKIEVDASGLATVEDKITLADLKLPAGVELADKELDPATVVANVYDPAVAAAKAEEEAKAAAEELAKGAEAEVPSDHGGEKSGEAVAGDGAGAAASDKGKEGK